MFSSRFLIFGSIDLLVKILFFFLKILAKFSACLTESFFSIILFAMNNALSNPTSILAWPALIFFSSTNFNTSLGKLSNLSELVI